MSHIYASLVDGSVAGSEEEARRLTAEITSGSLTTGRWVEIARSGFSRRSGLYRDKHLGICYVEVRWQGNAWARPATPAEVIEFLAEEDGWTPRRPSPTG